MLTNKPRRLGGVFIAVVSSVVIAATAMPAHALSPNDALLDPCTSLPGNLVANCGFEAPVVSGVVPGWTHLVSRNSSVGTLIAHSGGHSLAFASTTGDDVWTQTIPVTPNTQYLVGAQFDASTSTPNDDIALTATNVSGHPGAGTVIFSSVNTNLAWVRGADIVTTGTGRTMTLTLSGLNGPSATWVDDVFVLAQRSGCAAIANNLVGNCGFEAAAPGPWQHPVSSDSQITTNPNGGTQGLRLASSGTEDVWKQTFTIRPHTRYTLTYWAEYLSGGSGPHNHLTVSVSNAVGSLNIATTDVANRFWARVARTFTTGAATTATVTVSGANLPDETNVDDFSVTAVSHVAVSHVGRKVTTILTGVGGQRVLLQKLVHGRWVTIRSFVAPKTGWSKSWKVSVPKGKFRAVSLAAPGYVSTTSSTITVH